MKLSFKKILSKLFITRYIYLFFNYFFIIRNRVKNIQFRSYKNNEGKKILIPLIETNHSQIFQLLIIAKALEIRGAKVKVILCGSILKGCEIKSEISPKIDPCLTCRFNREKILPHFNINTIDIKDLLSKEDLNIIDINSKKEYLNLNTLSPENKLVVDDSVLRYFYGALPENSNKKEVIQDHVYTALVSDKVARNIINIWQPDIILNNMSDYSTWYSYFNIKEVENIKQITISNSTFDFNKIVINRKDLYKDNERFSSWLKTRLTNQLNVLEKEELKHFIEQRFSGLSEIFIQDKIFEKNDSDKILELLDINKDKINIFLFTNLFWDVGLSEFGNLYNNVIDWVLDTISIIKDNDNVVLYIKTHPAEKYGPTPSSKYVTDFITEKFKNIPSNVQIIDPDLKIKTYDLFPFIDLGIVFNGTIGLEMLLSNIPVVVTGLSPYSFLKSIYKPVNKSEYEIILNKKSKPLNQNNYNEIELFSYFYFIKNLIPWNLTDTAYGNKFKGYTIKDENDLLVGKNKSLDHICNCILNETIIENWNF
jgi:hypothetical protein